MKHILKPFAAWGTALKQDKFRYATIRLTAYYVWITFCILFVSSMITLMLFVPPEQQLNDDVFELPHSVVSVHEFREHLADVLLATDVAVLIFVGILAYFFARKTLEPLKEVYDLQERFIGDVAHELRTPLAIMLSGATSLLQQSRSGEEYKEFIEDVRDETNRLNRLSNQLLLILKHGSTHSTRQQPIDFSAIVRRGVAWCDAYAHNKQVTLHTDIAPEVHIAADADSVTQVLQNLLKNAVDYNKKHGEIFVTVSAENDTATLTVRDTGIGISEEKQAYVFDRFYKADTARQAKDDVGAGLGLAIVKELVSALGGSIALQSKENEGTTISLEFPLADTHS